MERYRFILFDKHKVIIESRDYLATNDDVAVRLAEGWRDTQSGHVWRDDKLIKQWKHVTTPKRLGGAV